MTGIERLLIVGNPSQEHIGAHFVSAALQLGIDARLLDLREAWSGVRWLNRISYHFFRRRPTRLIRFSRRLVAVARAFQPQMVLITGISAPGASALRELGKLGVRTCNFLTDDPWNPGNAAGFFRSALREYHAVFSPRRRNMNDLGRLGCRRVEYLPFAYNPNMHFPEDPATPAECDRFRCDAVIVGGADEDRVPLAVALAQAKLTLALYGGYWDRYPELRPYYKGFAHGADFRKAVRAAAVNICMVRRANRDGHAMRTFEVPAVGACMVAEETPEHREIFGPDGETVRYFRTPNEMVETTTWLLARPAERERLRDKVHRHITQGHNTYGDRLAAMINHARPQAGACGVPT